MADRASDLPPPGRTLLGRNLSSVRRLIEEFIGPRSGPMLGATIGTLGIRAMVIVSQVGVFALAARRLDMADVGIYAVVNAIWTLARQLGPLGFDQLALRVVPAYLVAEREDLALATDRFARRVVLLATLALALPTTVGLLWFGAGFIQDATTIVLLCAGLPVHAVIGLLAGQIRARQRLAASLIPEAAIVQPGLLVAALVMWWGNWFSLAMLLTSQVALACLSAGVYYRLCHGATVEPAILSADDKRWQVRTAGEIFASLLAGGLRERVPTLAAAAIFGPAAAAVVEVAVRVALIPVQITWAVSITVVQAMSHAVAQGDRAQLERLITLASRLAFMPAAVFLAVIAVVGQPAIAMIFGRGFQEAYWPAVLLCAAVAFNARYTPASQLFLLSGGQRTVLAFTLAALATVLAGIFVSGILATGAATQVICVTAAMLVGAIVRDGGLRLLQGRRIAAIVAGGPAGPMPARQAAE
jgi:O-antigen/teichoic acid export membrane protein